MKKAYKYILLVTIGILVVILVFANLGNRFLLPDEANTVLLGENVLKYGYPRSWDGDYLITSENGNDFNDNFVYLYYPWVQYYISAFSQLFGNSNFHLRFWFSLLGIISVIPFYYLSLSLTTKQKTAFLATILYSLSVPVLMLIRTIRYYSPSLLFIILIYFFYQKFIKNLSYKYCILFALSSILLFYTFISFYFITMAVIISCYMIFDINKKNIIKFLISLAMISGFTFFYFINYYSFIASIRIKGFQGIYSFVLKITEYFWMLHIYFFPIISLMIIYLLTRLVEKGFGKKHIFNYDNIIAQMEVLNSDTAKIKKRTKWLLIMPIVINILFISMYNVYYSESSLIACLPLTFILSAYIISRIVKYDKVVGMLVVLMFVFSNILNISPYYGIKMLNIETSKPNATIPCSYMERGKRDTIYNLNDYLDKNCYVRFYVWDYFISIDSDFNDEMEDVVKFLKIYAQKGDLVAAGDWMADGIHYYTGLNIANRLYLPEEAEFRFEKFKNAYKYMHLTESDGNMVDWVVVTGAEDWKEKFWDNKDIFEKIVIYDYPVLSPPVFIYRNKRTTMPIGITVFKEEFEQENVK